MSLMCGIASSLARMGGSSVVDDVLYHRRSSQRVLECPHAHRQVCNLDAKANGGHVSVTVTSHMRLKQLNVVGRTCSFTKSAPNFGVDPYLCILLCVQAWRQVKNE